VINASGKETRGRGNAAAVVNAELKENGDTTACLLTTDLTISGKAAQFGRGVLADVATKFIGQFADRLEADVLSASSASAVAASEPASTPARTETPAESVDLLAVVAEPLAELGEDAKILAGGQSLVPMLSLRLAFFDHLIDISRLAEPKGIERRGDAFWIGAGTTDATVGTDPQVGTMVPLLTRVTPFVGHFQICNRGTLGGSMAHADPAAEYPTVALALDATMEAVSPHGRRDIAAADFFTEGIVNAVHRAAELIRSATSAASRG